jgi:Tfp pilus assembly protein FimT
MNDDRGHSLAEILVALTIFMVGSAAAVPALKAYIVDSKLVGAALIFKGTFRRARSIAVRSGAQTAIRFEERADGIYFALYSDGNYNTTWGVALSDAAALALVPATASAGPVPARVRLSRDGSVVIWQAERLLQADSQHVVTCSGLVDRRGREVSPHLSRFLVCDLARADLGT